MSHRSVAPPRVVNIEDLRRAAKRRLPRAVFDYIDRGAEAEVTLRENCSVFDRITFRPRRAVATADTQLCTKILGLPLALPIMLAPVGSSRLFYPRGDVVAVRAAGEARTAYILWRCFLTSRSFSRARDGSRAFCATAA